MKNRSELLRQHIEETANRDGLAVIASCCAYDNDADIRRYQRIAEMFADVFGPESGVYCQQTRGDVTFLTARIAYPNGNPTLAGLFSLIIHYMLDTVEV